MFCRGIGRAYLSWRSIVQEPRCYSNFNNRHHHSTRIVGVCRLVRLSRLLYARSESRYIFWYTLLMHPLLEKQNDLHTEATSLLNDILMPILKQYGNVTVGGSYAYQLLNHPDLDIDIVNENVTKETFAALCAALISLDTTAKFKSADRVNYPHANAGVRPFGYWISPEIHFGKNVWVLDIWLQKPECHTGNTNRYEKELLSIDEEKRITILSLKEELVNKKMYGIGKEFVSIDVYEGVLRGGVQTIEDLREFISKKITV